MPAADKNLRNLVLSKPRRLHFHYENPSPLQKLGDQMAKGAPEFQNFLASSVRLLKGVRARNTYISNLGIYANIMLHKH